MLAVFYEEYKNIHPYRSTDKQLIYKGFRGLSRSCARFYTRFHRLYCESNYRVCSEKLQALFLYHTKRLKFRDGFLCSPLHTVLKIIIVGGII